MKTLKLFLYLSVIVILQQGCTYQSPSGNGTDNEEYLTVFLVRHAEKADLSKDPVLTPEGKKRASELAKTLRSAKIEYVHSSDFIRTRETASPLARELGLEVEIYDPRNLEVLAEELRLQGGRHLVVGHSTTTPPLVELLGGDPETEIDETSEYDRLYIVTVGKDGNANSILMRYGKPYSPHDSNNVKKNKSHSMF